MLQLLRQMPQRRFFPSIGTKLSDCTILTKVRAECHALGPVCAYLLLVQALHLDQFGATHNPLLPFPTQDLALHWTAVT